MLINNLRSKVFSLNTLLFFSILISFIGLALAYSLYTPTEEGPDEEAHYEYSYLLDRGTNYTYIQSQPLYYLIIGAFIKNVPQQDFNELPINQNFGANSVEKYVHGNEEIFPFSGIAKIVHLLRIFSIGCGAGTLIFTYKIAKLFFKENKWLPLFSASFLVFIPKFAFINSVLNDDVLVWLFSTMSLYFLFQGIRDPTRSKSLALCGIFSGLASISKMAGIILLPIVIVTLIYLISSRKINKKEFTRKIALYLFGFLIGGGVYLFYITFVTDQQTYTYLPRAYGGLSESQHWTCITSFENLDFRMFATVWGYQGWQTIGITSWDLFFAHLITIVAFVGLFLVYAKKTKLSYVSFTEGHSVILFTSILFAILSLLYFLWNICYGDARYTFTGISSMVILMTIGFYAIFDKKYLKLLMILPIIFVFVLNLQELQTMDEYYSHGVFSILPSAERYAASSEYSFTKVGNAFDSKLGTVWHSGLSMPQWIQVDYRKPTVLTHLEIIAGNLWHPKDFEIQGYNDPSKVTILKKITNECCWSALSTHDYSFENSNPYRFYRIYIIDGQGPTQAVEFDEVRFS